MTKGLTLIVVGHVNFILGAIVHGSVLRHISKPTGTIPTEYTVSNIIAVTSGLLVHDHQLVLLSIVKCAYLLLNALLFMFQSIASGIVAILVSRNIKIAKLVRNRLIYLLTYIS